MSEFDKYRGNYESIHNRNLWLSGEKTDYFAEYKVKEILSFYYGKAPPSQILDVGCSRGNLAKFLVRYYPGAEIKGIDISRKCIEEANDMKYKNCQFIFYNGQNIPFNEEVFDLVICSNVFHHVQSEERPALAAEVKRVLKKEADIFIFEHNPFNPLTVYTVKTCPFDKGTKLMLKLEIKQLLLRIGFQLVGEKYIVFFPYFLRFLRKFENKLGKLPWGAQYWLVARK